MNAEISETPSETKVSNITAKMISDYLRLDETIFKKDEQFLNDSLNIAKAYIQSYTGCKDLNAHSDFVIVIYILCQSMYDDRVLYVNNDKVNVVVSNILDMYSENLIC